MALKFPNKFATSDIIDLEWKRELDLKKKITACVENTDFKLFGRKARCYESGSVCNALISLIRHHNGP